METDPYGSSAGIIPQIGVSIGLAWWAYALLIALVLVAAVLLRIASLVLGRRQNGMPPGFSSEEVRVSVREGAARAEVGRLHLALALAARLCAFCGLAMIVPLFFWIDRISPIPWAVAMVVTVLVLASASFAVDALIYVFATAEADQEYAQPLLISGRVLSFLLTPVVAPLRSILARLSARAHALRRRGDAIADDTDVETGVLEEHESQLGDYIAHFRDTEVGEVMTSRMDIKAIATTATLQEAVDIIASSGHSRLPLYRDHLDHIEGIIYAKDLLPLLVNGKSDRRPDWTEIARPPLMVTGDQSIEQLLRAFKVGTTHVALVVDEYGGTEGLVTLEDVLEELVGDIRDEFDQHEPILFELIEPGSLRFDARIDLDAFKVIVGTYLDAETAEHLETEQFEFETLGGLVQHLTESVPDSGIEVRSSGLIFRVDDVEQHRICHVIVSVAGPSANPAGETAPGDK